MRLAKQSLRIYFGYGENREAFAADFREEIAEKLKIPIEKYNRKRVFSAKESAMIIEHFKVDINKIK